MEYILNHVESIKKLCEKYHVNKLYVFGSALTGDFTTSSDIDLIAEFKAMPGESYADNYFPLKHKLENLFGQPVDLLEDQAIRNPYFRQSVTQKRQLIYRQ